MANGGDHRLAGMALGAGFACYQARKQSPEDLLIEALGGVIGGNLGARMPDIIDPPLHPRHRSLGHGVVPVGAGAYASVRSLQGWQEFLRREANRRAELSPVANSPLESLWHWVVSLLCRLGAGAVAGFLAGYGSHILMDAVTPSSLPLIA